jgi:hypothetical protein
MTIPVKPSIPRPLPPRASPASPGAAAPQPQSAAEPPIAPVSGSPIVTAEELAQLRSRLARAEARVKELEAPATTSPSSGTAPNPFLPVPPPSDVAIAQSVPLVQLAPATAAFVAARPGRISISPTGLVSIMPFDGAKKRRRAQIAVVSVVLVGLAAIVAVMVLSRAMH